LTAINADPPLISIDTPYRGDAMSAGWRRLFMMVISAMVTVIAVAIGIGLSVALVGYAAETDEWKQSRRRRHGMFPDTGGIKPSPMPTGDPHCSRFRTSRSLREDRCS
jgi:hypothetical protein